MALIKPGDRFGRLTVVRASHVNKHRKRTYECLCDCGETAIVEGVKLRNRRTKSCGCLRRDTLAEVGRNNRTHGHTAKDVGLATPTYRTWISMHSRVKSDPHYMKYTVAKEWEDFETFLADMGERPKGKTLDRINNEDGYHPANCRWATLSEQCNNRSTSRWLTHDGETMLLAEWADRLGLKYHTLHKRLEKGWSIERALTTPLASQSKEE